MKHIVKLGTDR
jgi:hypothetical protein